MPAKKKAARKYVAKKAAKKRTAKKKSVETLTHDEAKRKNIPTAEHQSVLEAEQKAPKTLRYPRNTDLDPQLVWRGKDEQDWSDLVVTAPPLYIQEKVHPKALIGFRLQRRKLLRPPRLLPRPERPLQIPQNHPQSRNQPRCLGHPPLRHLPTLRSPEIRKNRRQSHQPPRR